MHSFKNNHCGEKVRPGAEQRPGVGEVVREGVLNSLGTKSLGSGTVKDAKKHGGNSNAERKGA